MREFEFDGVVILPKRVINGYRDNKYEKCRNAIIRQNGAIKKLCIPKWLDACDTIKDVLVNLQRRDIWPAIEMFVGDGSDTAFYLGPITNVDDESFCHKCYDAAGKWEKVYELSDDDLCRIEFDSNYCNSFNAYMRSKKDK